MPRLGHTKPCPQCPWRRASAPGWLGDADPQQFAAATLAEAPMPCHSAIDYEDPDWRTSQLPRAPLCAGSLVFLANTCKLPRDPEHAAAVAAVAPDRDVVFAHVGEFLEHHDR
jgi:hypothetical protein